MAIRDNVRIGDCEVYINYGSSEVFLGQTKGGIEFSYEREFEDLTVDKFGTSPIDMALTGNNLTIKVMLAEPTTYNLSVAIPEGLYAAGTNNDSKLGLGATSGYLAGSDAGELRLHPRRNSPSSRNDDVYIWKAVPVETVPLNYKVDEQRVIEITFRALIDESQPEGQYLGRVGDATIS